MSWERLYQILQPETAGTAARAFRIVHHAMVVLGIAHHACRYGSGLAASPLPAFSTRVSDRLRLFYRRIPRCGSAAAAAAPAAHRRGWQARLAWMMSAERIVRSAGRASGRARRRLQPEIREPLRLCLGLQADPLFGRPGEPAAGDQPGAPRAAVGAARFRYRAARRRQPCLSARAQRSARTVRLDPAGACGGRSSP